jgi:starvation-inducible outer membrane lipoprotein
MRFAWIIAFAVLAGCAGAPGAPGGLGPSSRQFEAPVARVKPAFVSTLASMGMMIASVETRSGREVLKARKGSSEVEIELEAVSRTTTRARVAAKSGGLLYDEDTANRIMRQAATLLGGT